MCVNIFENKLRKIKIDEFKKSLKGRKTFIGHKVIRLDGRPAMFSENFTYKPGVNQAKVDNYTGNRPLKSKNRYCINNAGIHVYLKNDRNRHVSDNEVKIEVTCHVDDLLAIDNYQAALFSVRITKKQWKTFERRANRKTKALEKAKYLCISH